MRVADDLIDSVEVVESEEHDRSDHEVNDRPSKSDLCFVDEPDVAGDAAAFVMVMVLLAVMLAYLRIGNTFMKLRVNMIDY